MGPFPLDSVVEGFLAVEVVPQPLYPLPSVCAISPSSPLLLVPPTAGSVGSLLGLKPYSSTSFRRRSAASLRCFRRRHRSRAASTMIATAATGTTTATAILPPAERPLVLPEPEPDVASGPEPEDLLAGDVDVVVGVFVAAGNRC